MQYFVVFGLAFFYFSMPPYREKEKSLKREAKISTTKRGSAKSSFLENI